MITLRYAYSVPPRTCPLQVMEGTFDIDGGRLTGEFHMRNTAAGSREGPFSQSNVRGEG